MEAPEEENFPSNLNVPEYNTYACSQLEPMHVRNKSPVPPGPSRLRRVHNLVQFPRELFVS